MSYEIDPDGRWAGLAIGLFGVLAVFAAFGGLRGAPGALILLGVCVLAVVVLSIVLRRRGLILDERGITDARADETIPWAEVAGLEIVDRPGGRKGPESYLAVQRIDGLQVEIPISGLEARPEVVLERAERVRTSESQARR